MSWRASIELPVSGICIEMKLICHEPLVVEISAWRATDGQVLAVFAESAVWDAPEALA